MRYSALLLLIFSFFSLKAQDCPPGDVTISSSSTLENFLSQYPNCTQINGNLTSANLLDTIPNLESITGNLMGGPFPVFSHLKYIEGDLSGAINANAFPVLEYIGGDLRDESFYGFSTFDGFDNLEYIGGDAIIQEGDICCFNELDTIGGSLIFAKPQEDQWPVRVDVTGLNQLKYIGGNLEFDARFDEFYPDQQVCAKNLSGLSALDYIGGDFTIVQHWEGCEGTDEIIGLENLKEIGGDLYVHYSPLINLDFLSQLHTIGESLILTTNSLEDISGLNHSIDIGGALIIEDNPNLSECAVQAVCDHMTSGGTTTIYDNLAGCDSIQEVEASCNVDCLDDLILTTQQEVDDFTVNYPGCFQIGGNLIINGITPTEINNLDGLSEIISVSDTLFIVDNQALTDISGLENIDYSDLKHIQISGNSMLSACSITSVCRFIANEGTNSIYNNNQDCNSDTEIRNNCMICPDSNIYLNSQEDVDEYRTLYPGCTNVAHSIRIENDEIDNLNGLIEIEHIEGCLTIKFCSALTNLSGLDNLESVNCLNIQHNELTDILALSNLSTVQGTFTLIGSVDLAGLENLQYIGHFEMLGNDIVTDFTAFSSIDTLRNISLYGNDNLTSLDGLQNLTFLINVSISNHSSLSSLTGLDNVVSINDFIIGGNDALQSMAGLNGLTHITGYMSIGNGTTVEFGSALNTFSGLDNLTTIGEYLFIVGSHELSNFEGLNNLTNIGGEFKIYANNTLNNLSGLESLVAIGSDLSITYNDALENLDGLENLTTIGGGLIMEENDGLTSLAGLNNLQTIESNLRIEDNHELTDLSGLESLITIGGGLLIESTQATSLEGLNNLQTVNGDLRIGGVSTGANNALLQDISALSSLTSINGKLSILANYDLTTIANSFENLDHNTITHLEIQYNQNLSTCNAQVICDYLNVGENITIGSNDPGCDSVAEVEASCDPMLCPPGDITLATQQEIDAFSATYPNCTGLLGKLTIRADNPNDISNLDALSQLTSTGNGLLIDNTSITNLNGLQNLTTTGYNLVITNNLNLTSLAGLENITSTASHLKIENNDALIDLSGLNNITQVGESVLIFDNDNLQNLTGLNALTSIGSQLYLKNNTNMTSLSGLESLTSIGMDIRIQAHPNLSSLSTLSNVATINGYMRITDNNALTSLMGLENINPDGITEIMIINNPNLSMCSASSVCGHIEDDGTTTFSNNAEGCNSAEEVDTACGALPIEMTDPLRVYLKNKTAILEWRTATEVDNAGFEIQRSKDGIEWERIGWQAGQGNSSTSHSYRYVDENPLFGTSYYRFKQVDFNGDFTYSNIVALQYTRPRVTISPNPNIGIFNVQATTQATYKILNTSGQIIQSGELKNQTFIDISKETQGVYFMSISIDNQIFTKRIVKI